MNRPVNGHARAPAERTNGEKVMIFGKTRFVALAGALLGGATLLMAQPGTGLVQQVPFELDGNATTGAKTDWQSASGTSLPGSLQFTGIVPDPGIQAGSLV